jgi:hypothetical protein
MFPVGIIGSVRACGAIIIVSPQTSVVSSNMLPIAVVGSIDSHGGVGMFGSSCVFVNNLPVLYVTTPNDVCKNVYPHHYVQPLVTGDISILIDP